ncbi:MAG: 16S rRNA (uracil(1498)-N(3))-methyltransferase [Rhodoferax sp.]|nr:16S rRNA (uracil(1498)-N(3))-methyltransferase [Rhodoferax sp.]
MPRLYVPGPWSADAELELPPAASRHVQVLRLQPGDALTLFDGQGGQRDATVLHMGRREVTVRTGAAWTQESEPLRPIQLALGVPANDRMDWLIEKATELGVSAIQPLLCERSVLRASGERAEKKLAHWRGIAVAACEQCGGNRLPEVHDWQALTDWLRQAGSGAKPLRLLLSLQPDAQPLGEWLQRSMADAPVRGIGLLSGPEGGLSPAEETLARSAGWTPVSLGARVLRAETAALAALAALQLHPATTPSPAR